MSDAGELVHDLLLLVLELQGSIRTAMTSPGTALDTNTTFPSICAIAFPSAPTDSTVTPRTISFSFFLLIGCKFT